MFATRLHSFTSEPRLRSAIGIALLAAMGLCGLNGCDSANRTTGGAADGKSNEIPVVDLGQLPLLPDTKLHKKKASQLEASSPASIGATAEHYLAKLAEHGWKIAPGEHSKMITGEYAQATLVKGLGTITLSVTQSGEQGQTMLSIHDHGTLDAEKLPTGEQMSLIYGGKTTAIRVSKASVAEATENVARALAADGWQEFTTGDHDRLANAEMADLDFRRGRNHVSVYVCVAPAQNNQTSVQFGVHAIDHELPAPPTATEIKFDDDRWDLTFHSPQPMAELADFYRQAMPAAGYQAFVEDEPTDKQMLLRYKTAAGDILMVVLNPGQDGGAKSHLYGVPAELLRKWDEEREQAEKKAIDAQSKEGEPRSSAATSETDVSPTIGDADGE